MSLAEADKQGTPKRPPDDPKWPRASAWLRGEGFEKRGSCLGVIGVPLNASLTPGRPDLAPAAIRKAMERFGSFDFQHNSDLRDIQVEDVGDLDVASLRPEDALAPVSEAIKSFSSRRVPVVILGGDNSATYCGVHGLGVPLEKCGLLTLDAHFDLRDTDKGLHNGNPVRALLEEGMLGQHIVQIGIQPFVNSADYAAMAHDSGIDYVPVEEVFERGVDRTMRAAFEQLKDCEKIYCDLDLDVMDRSFAPATPGSRPGGLLPWMVRKIAHLCGTQYNIAAMDLVEIDPTKDIADVTCLTAAACLLGFASGTFERREVK